MKKTVRWGLLATGGIAGTFAAALKAAEGAELAAVGSRDMAKARQFARQHGVARSFGSYADLAADPQVDAVYVATPHAFHERDTILCLEQGKHVLCEKPLALNAGQARRMIDAARRHDRLLMEAMWTRFLPSMSRLKGILDEGLIGEPRLLMAAFCIRPPFDPDHRLFAPALGGGALLDLGVYAVSVGHWLFGAPRAVAGAARLGTTGVDEDSAAILKHAAGRLTLAHQSLVMDVSRQAIVRGTAGEVLLHEPWWGTARLTVRVSGEEPRDLNFQLEGGGYSHMAEAFMDLIRGGHRESAAMPLADSVAVLESLDTLRRHYELEYPGE